MCITPNHQVLGPELGGGRGVPFSSPVPQNSNPCLVLRLPGVWHLGTGRGPRGLWDPTEAAAIPQSTVHSHLAEKPDCEKVLEATLGREGGICRFVETDNAIRLTYHRKHPPAEDIAGESRGSHGATSLLVSP